MTRQEEQAVAAAPLDVRKVSDFPEHQLHSSFGLRPDIRGKAPKGGW
ncbi:MAG: hypothetical protein HY314_13195 [Acidobacteria bacterium]|nr:hypothetical protein [Acidobacteriota bacterium]